MKRVRGVTLADLATPRYDINQRVRLVGLDRYIYRIGNRRQVTRTRSQLPEYLIFDANGQKCGWQFEDKLRPVEADTRDRCPECRAVVRVTTHRYDNYDVTEFGCDECGAGGEL